MDAFVSGVDYQDNAYISSDDNDDLPLENLINSSDDDEPLNYPRGLNQSNLNHSFSQPPLSQTPDEDIYANVVRNVDPPTQFDQISNITSSTVFNKKNNKSAVNFYDSFTMKYVIDEESDVMCLKFKDKRLFVGLANGQIRVYTRSYGTFDGRRSVLDSKNGLNCQYILEDDETYRNSVTSLEFVNPPGTQNEEPLLVVTYVTGLVKFWHVTGKQCLSSIKEKGSESLACSIDRNQKFMYTAGDNLDKRKETFAINRYDVETCKLVGSYSASSGTTQGNYKTTASIDGHVRRIFSVKCNPVNENYFISAGWDDTIQYWDVRQPHAVKRIVGPHVCSESGLDISQDGQHILAGSWRRIDNIQIFNWASGKLENSIRMSPRQFPVQPYAVKFLDKRTIGVGSSSENTLMTFDIDTKSKGKYDVPLSKISNLPGGVYSIDHILQDAHKNEDDEMDMHRVFAVASGSNVFIVKENRFVNCY